MKDWTGNKTTTFVQLGASSHSEKEREEDDYYATDPKALEIFLDKIKEDDITLNNNIWECACGEGHLSNVLLQKNYGVISTDVVDRNYKYFSGEINFLNCDDTIKCDGDILTNPPYKYAKEFVEKAMEIVKDGNKVIMFLKIQFLEGKARLSLFDKYPPKYVYVNSSRQICYLNGKISEKMSSASCYCWFIWEKGFTGEPIIRWI